MEKHNSSHAVNIIFLIAILIVIILLGFDTLKKQDKQPTPIPLMQTGPSSAPLFTLPLPSPESTPSPQITAPPPVSPVRESF